MKFGWGADFRLVKRAIGGDRSAADRLVQDHYPGVLRFLLHLTGSLEEAEEIAQETFVRGWRGLDSFGGSSSFKTWIHSVAYREFLAFCRAKTRYSDGPTVEESVQPDFSSNVINSIVLQNALRVLPEEQRVALLLVHVQALTVSEAATILGVPRGTVMSRVATARQRIGQMLEPNEKKANRYESNPLEGGCTL